MLNILIADDNIYFVKTLINFVIGKNPNIKILNVLSNGLEVLKFVEENHDNIDLILLDLKMPGLDGVETLDRLYNMKLSNYPNVFVISSKSLLISKIANHPLVIDFVDKCEGLDTIFNKIQDYEKMLNFWKMQDSIEQKIDAELFNLGYNPSHIGTKYIKECILTIYESNSSDYNKNLEDFVYKKVAFSHGKTIQIVKTNIMKATNFMYVESDMSFLKNYFHFSDIKRKPTPKVVISTILSKL